MVDFRKLLLAFAAVALLVVFMAPANAQTPFACLNVTSTTVQVRAEGLTELMGDILLTCSGGTPTPVGQPIPQTNFVVGLNTNITSRLLSVTGASGAIDSLILVDEPIPCTAQGTDVAGVVTNACVSTANPATFTPLTQPNPNVQVHQSAPCFSNTSGPLSLPANCNAEVAIPSTTAPAPGAATAYVPPYLTQANIFLAHQQDVSHVTWLGVPVDPPGTTGILTFRFTNIRANANLLGVSSTLVSTTIYANISVNGSTTFQVTTSQVSVATIVPGLSASATGATSLAQCSSLNVGIPPGSPNFNSTTNPNGCAEFAIKLVEGFAASFKPRIVPAAYLVAGTTVPFATGIVTPGLQDVPGFTYNTESAFTPTLGFGGQTPGAIGTLGVADTGSRFLIKLNNVGAGTQLVFPIAVPLTVVGTTCAAGPAGCQGNPPTPTSGASAGWTGGFLRLIAGTPDINGNFGLGASNGYVPTSGTLAFGCYDTNVFSSSPFALGIIAPWDQGITITATSGTAEAVYEVVNSDPAALEQANVPVGVAYTSNTGQNLPATGQVTANATWAPLSTVGTADPSAPVPRFAPTGSALNVFNITSCTCNLLFPFVANQAGYDTGVAIANTSQDPFGTSPQSGTVTLNYYGSTTGGGAAPAAQTSQSVTAGTELVFTLSGGGNLGITAAAGFEGYIIAQAKFQYCHGFAFITNAIGTPNAIAEGYLAIQLDAPGLTRTNNVGENKGE